MQSNLFTSTGHIAFIPSTWIYASKNKRKNQLLQLLYREKKNIWILLWSTDSTLYTNVIDDSILVNDEIVHTPHSLVYLQRYKYVFNTHIDTLIHTYHWSTIITLKMNCHRPSRIKYSLYFYQFLTFKNLNTIYDFLLIRILNYYLKSQ